MATSNETIYKHIRSAIMHNNIVEAERLLGINCYCSCSSDYPLKRSPDDVVTYVLPERAVYSGDEEYLKRLKYLAKNRWGHKGYQLVIPPVPEWD